MRRLTLALLPLLSIACSGGNFDVADPAPDTGTREDGSGVDGGGTDIGTPDPDTGVVVVDAPSPPDAGDTGPVACPEITAYSPDVYVSATAAGGGNGSAACPYRGLAQAAAVPLATGITRVVHVQAGTYGLATPVKIRTRETYKGEGGFAKVVTPASAGLCAPAGVNCAFLMEASSTLDYFIVDGGGVSAGIVANAAGSAETRPQIRNTAVKNMARDGIVVFGSGARLGPNAQATDNGYSGLVVRGGYVSVDGGGNAFDRNKGGFWSGATFIPGSGIHVYAGTLFVDNGASASNNHTGVTFDATGFSSTQQILSQIDILSNRTSGVVVNKDWTKLQIRKANINKNAQTGLYLVYNDAATNEFDLGPNASTGPGNNIFGNSTAKNLKAALFLCRSGGAGSLLAERNTWGTCPPSQQQVANCDAMPATYVDVAYVPGPTSTGSVGTPLMTPTSCLTL
ncbi:MAG: right-handed parallel beta-helix repeat-containing protein [Deltaproteobacteria bacterium]|nr:right-handed parallel beta-helix repeat-containing protein [Deltaproteobacteria bacterium]